MANNQLLASDSFGSGSLAPGWSAQPGQTAVCSVVSGSPNVTEPTSTSGSYGQLYTGITWPNDHTSEITCPALTAEAGTIVRLWVRNQPSVDSNYLALIQNGVATIFRTDSGTTTSLSTVSGLTFGANDVWTFSAFGSLIVLYRNSIQVLAAADTTYSSGAPGYGQSSSVNVTHTKVASWRGYNAVQQDGIWQKQGIVLPALTADLNTSPNNQGIQLATILREGNAQLLSGTVFKAWLLNGYASTTAAAVYYAESTDGINWTRKSAAVLSGYTNGCVYKIGATYYMVAQTAAGNGGGTFQILTSPEGLTWTLQSPSQTISLGSGGAWDNAGIYPGNVQTVGSTYYMLYLGSNSSASSLFSTGLALSTDGVNWTKYNGTGGPVLSGALPQSVNKVGNTFFGWFNQNQKGQGNAITPFLDPIEVMRYQSPDLINWSNPVKSVHHSQLFEGVNTNSGLSIVSGSRIFDVNGKAYMYVGGGLNDSGNSPIRVNQIALAIAPATVEQVVLFPEDAAQYVARDPFTRAPGGLGSNWTTVTGKVSPQIASSGVVEPNSQSNGSVAVYTGSSFGSNQFSELTLKAAASTTEIDLIVNAQTSAQTYYIGSCALTALGTISSVNIVKLVSGAQTTLMNSSRDGNVPPVPQWTPFANDVFRFSVAIGSDGFPLLQFFQNGFLIASVQDTFGSPLTGGNPGIILFDSSANANAQISAWAGGNVGVLPAYAGGSSAGGLGTNFRERFGKGILQKFRSPRRLIEAA